MPARRSTSVPSIPATLLPRKYSPRKRDVEKAIGKQMISARIEVSRVPAIKGNAPYASRPSVGFHSVEKINFRPNSLNPGNDPLKRDQAIPPAINTIIAAAKISIILVIFSPFIQGTSLSVKRIKKPA
jgi:hypothetical protein